ncbi:helix-turn-helix transcriptional regulator [Enterococcus avium]|uniref:helix-turn-helix domain-containing protein n=1 Tax=Enterococcus avium TaxID=33945 RepID=UPI00288FDF51|nr:helix-turn-helix transcriptional regulator [Enterococcus avium]MDT2416098.1 helix-turn-helix transcriptional regulator [Enterococcus avium]MDT2476852.1 helix-turn-helix transcriptional regulator [Enterococcus avium]
MLFERVKELSKKRDKNLKEVAIELGFSENAFYKWKTQSPKAETLEKVAEYFDVSVDYLLGRTDDPHFSPSRIEDEDDYEQELIMMFRKGEKEVAPEKRDLYRKQTKDLMSFISKTMKELDDEENE